MSSSTWTDNKGKDILLLGKGPTQGLSEYSLAAKKMYSINFTRITTKFCLTLQYNGANSYLFVMVQKFINLQQKILRLFRIICAWTMFQKSFQQVK